MEAEMVEELRLSKERERERQRADSSESYFIRTAPPPPSVNINGSSASTIPSPVSSFVAAAPAGSSVIGAMHDDRSWSGSVSGQAHLHPSHHHQGHSNPVSIHQRTPRHAHSTEFNGSRSGYQHSNIALTVSGGVSNSGTRYVSSNVGTTPSASFSGSGGSGSGSDSSPLSSPSPYWNFGFDNVALPQQQRQQTRPRHVYTSSIESAASFAGPHLPSFITKEDVNDDLAPSFTHSDQIDITFQNRDLIESVQSPTPKTFLYSTEGNKAVGEAWSSRQRVSRARTISSSDDDAGSSSTPPPASPASASFSAGGHSTGGHEEGGDGFGFKFNFNPVYYGTNSSSTELTPHRELGDAFNGLTIRAASRVVGKY